MALQHKFDKISNSIADAYDVCEKKGALIPEIKNTENLAATIATINFKPEQKEKLGEDIIKGLERLKILWDEYKKEVEMYGTEANINEFINKLEQKDWILGIDMVTKTSEKVKVLDDFNNIYEIVLNADGTSNVKCLGKSNGKVKIIKDLIDGMDYVTDDTKLELVNENFTGNVDMKLPDGTMLKTGDGSLTLPYQFSNIINENGKYNIKAYGEEKITIGVYKDGIKPDIDDEGADITTDINIFMGETYKINLPANYIIQELVYSSSDEDIATVDDMGKIQAIQAGEVTITVTKDGESIAEYNVIVGQVANITYILEPRAKEGVDIKITIPNTESGITKINIINKITQTIEQTIDMDSAKTNTFIYEITEDGEYMIETEDVLGNIAGKNIDEIIIPKGNIRIGEGIIPMICNNEYEDGLHTIIANGESYEVRVINYEDNVLYNAKNPIGTSLRWE